MAKSNFEVDKNARFISQNMKTDNLKKWTYDFDRLLFIRKKDKVAVPEEYYEDYKGHYNNPTDKLLDALFELICN